MASNKIKMTIYTAEDEPPKCIRCDNVIASDELCEKSCGSEHGWAGYVRVAIEGKEDKNERTE